ncbi:MAG: Gmad2 immunoglobulin-like domain-containing protein [Patescibacteria group bacterium]
MNTRAGWSVLAGATLLIFVLTWVLFATPAPVEAPTTSSSETGKAAPTSPKPAADQPLHTRVTVTFPKSGASVGKTFVVAGSAPGNWFFEGSFPVQVRDAENSKIGQGIAQAQGDWMTTDLVTFTTNITVSNYSGPATLVLLRDNPSGLPENDDALEVSIVIR